MEYYHLVTRIPMYKGQIIDFSKGEHNRLYEFWMKREERTEEGKDTFFSFTISFLMPLCMQDIRRN